MHAMNQITTPHRSAGRNDGAHIAGWIATALVIIGALNWLLVGLFDFNIVAALFGDRSVLTRIVYVAVGLGGLYEIYFARLLSREAHGIGERAGATV
jgi:uncharacterized membrane protein YuzA (DUF378 family)